MKLVFFAQELLTPIKVAPGQVIEMDDRDYEDLRAQAKEGFIYNLTPSPLKPFIWQSVPPRPATNCVLVACPECMAQDQYRRWVCVKPMVKCGTCGDTRTVISTRFRVDKEGFIKNLREVIAQCVAKKPLT